MPTSYSDKFGIWFPQLGFVFPLMVFTGLRLGIGTAVSSYLRLHKEEAKEEAKEEPKEEAKKEAKEEAKEEAKKEVKEEVKKKVKEEVKKEVEDRISALTNEILCSILSRLDTKDAVRTSLLCSRWRNLYLFLPSYSFGCPCVVMFPFCLCSCTAEYKILTVMDRFFQIHRRAGCEKIKSFRLSFCVKTDFTCHIERWVHHLAGLGVEELTLKLCYQGEKITVPLQKLVCKAATCRLTFLHLTASNMELEPFNPQQPFKYLKSIELIFIDSVDVQTILSSCPKLESLSLEYCCLSSNEFVVEGKHLELKSLTIFKCNGKEVEEIYLCAENLLTLKLGLYSDLALKFSHPSHLPKLQHVSLEVVYNGHLLHIISWVAQDCSQVESFCVESWSRTSHVAYGLPLKVPTFSRLRQLDTRMEFNDLFDVTQIADLIIHCPLLQIMHLVGRERRTPPRPLGARSLSPRSHLHLKEVEFGGFNGFENEMSVVLYILKSALALERMVLRRDSRYTAIFNKSKGYQELSWCQESQRTSKFDESKSQVIHQQLRGQAASPTVQLLVI
ncbi:unnamed protein product [Cuscuta epithymum]|uniref:F-box domain-containing protein n=1 Tax=Cuscuta epithymum TaxID=186058 RepID=A0AAV0FPM2_9ASTE|nr:unnamed protein product [Cuscuta epithymum]